MVATPSTRERSLPSGFPEALTLPMALAASLRLTPEEFAEVYAANPDAVLELAADRSWLPLVPSGSETGRRNGELLVPIQGRARAHGAGRRSATPTASRPSAPSWWWSEPRLRQAVHLPIQ